MKAVIKEFPRKGGCRVVDDRPRPTPGAGEVLVRVKATAICGTDKHIYNWDESMAKAVAPLPYVPGHEFCGEISALGPGVQGWHVGEYVSAEMHVVSPDSRQTRTGNGHVCPKTRILGIHADGCFAEYVVVPASNVIRLDRKRVPLNVGAFLDALGNAVHTCFRVPLAGKRVLVLGYGPIGAMCAAIAHFVGAQTIYITDVQAPALERAEKWAHGARALAGKSRDIPITVLSTRGSDREQTVARIRSETNGGVDVALEISGHPNAINDGLSATDHGGDVVLLGIPSSQAITLEHYQKDLIFRGLTLHGIIGRRMYETWHQMLGLLGAGLRVEHIADLTVPLDGFEDAMAKFSASACQKAVLYPDPAYAAIPL